MIIRLLDRNGTSIVIQKHPALPLHGPSQLHFALPLLVEYMYHCDLASPRPSLPCLSFPCWIIVRLGRRDWECTGRRPHTPMAILPKLREITHAYAYAWGPAGA